MELPRYQEKKRGEGGMRRLKKDRGGAKGPAGIKGGKRGERGKE